MAQEAGPGPDRSAVHERLLETVLEDLGRRERAVVKLHRELVSRPALNPEHGGQGENDKARWLEGWLAKFDLVRQERYDHPDARIPEGVRPNIVAVMEPGDWVAEPPVHTLWIVTHLDVAAPGPTETWESQPFRLRLQGDLMFGRGVEDNHQAIVSALLLFETFQRLPAGPPLRLGAVFTSGALTDYRLGIQAVLERNPGLFHPDDLFVVPDYGDENGEMISVAEKTNLWVRITMTGRAAHAGFCLGPNAFKAAAAFVGSLDEMAVRFPARDRLFTVPTSTFIPTASENRSTGANHIPATFVFYLDARLVPGYTHEAVEQALRKLGRKVEKEEGVAVTLEVVERTPNAAPTSPEAPVVRLLKRAIFEELGRKAETVGSGGVTMASSLRAAGFQAAVWSMQAAGKNRCDECFSIRAQIAQTKVLARLMFDRRSLKKGRPPASREHPGGLTPKELEVAGLLGRGFSNERIMAELGIAKNTLRVHLRSIYRKTLAGGRRELLELCAAGLGGKKPA